MVDGLSEATILVRGTATVEVPPDYATITIRVRDRARSREKALDSVAARTAAVDGILDELGDVVSNRVTASARIVSTTGGRTDRGFEASRALVCEIRDASVLGALFERLADAESEFEGPWWHLDDTNPVHDQVRGKAAGDARVRAAAYATGVGQQIGRLRWLAEPGLRTPGDRRESYPVAPAAPVAPAPAASRFGRASDDQDEPLMEVVVENLTVSATVEAAFELAEARP